MEDLYESFFRYFEIVRADKPELLDAAYRMRYEVYCKENAFEDASGCPDQRERDEFDDFSVHTLVRHRKTGHFAGVVRLVLPRRDSTQPLFPTDVHVEQRYLKSQYSTFGQGRDKTAEISRLAVSPEFKRRIAEHGTLAGVSGNASYGNGHHLGAFDRRLLPHITLGLFAGIVQMSAEYGITHWLALMEPTLMRFLMRFGIQFRAVGPLVSYHGSRQPAIADAGEVLEAIHQRRRDVWDILTMKGTVWPLTAVRHESNGAHGSI